MGSKHSLLIKFDQFKYYKRKNFVKIFYKNCNLKSSRPFCVYKEFSTTSIGKWNFWSKLLMLDINISKTIKTCHSDFLGFLFTEDYYQVTFWQNFFVKKIFFLWNITQTSQVSLPDCVYFPSYSLKCFSCFMLTYLMTS